MMRRLSVPRELRRRLGSASRRLVAASLLLLLLAQISPFTVTLPASLVSRNGEIVLSIEPLQVCDSGAGAAGTPADHHWLPALTVATIQAPTAAFDLPAPSPLLAEGHPRRLLRPPRVPSLL